MIDLASFKNAQLRGGFIIEEVTIADEPLIDAIRSRERQSLHESFS
jgi:hypothetical protein